MPQEPQPAPRQDTDNHPTHPLHEIDDAMVRLPLAARARRGAGVPPAPARHAAARPGRHPDADRAGGRRRHHHAGRRRQPGARLRHRRCGQPDPLSLENRRSEGRGRHALGARGRPRLGRRSLRAGGVLDRVPGGRAVGDRVVRRGHEAVRAEDQGRQGYRLDAAADRGDPAPLQAGVRAAHVLGRGGLLRCPGAARAADRPGVERPAASSIRKAMPPSSGPTRKRRRPNRMLPRP